jgi:hypothetical protein
MRFGIYVSGLRVSGVRIPNLGFRAFGQGFRVSGLRFRL